MTLCFWYDIEPSEINTRRAQLILAMRRTAFVSEELESVLNANDISDMLERLTYHAENYFIRAYELRERAVFLIAGVCGNEELAKSLKDGRRGKALDEIGSMLPALVEPMDGLLKALDDDMRVRNVSTHKTFLSLALSIDDKGPLVDPRDALLNEDAPDKRAEYESFLRGEVNSFIAGYVKKCNELNVTTMSLLKAINKVLPDSNRS